MADKTVFMFPGQGSQVVGMRGALSAAGPEIGHLFAAADEVLGFPLSGLIDNGPLEELTRTSNAQPALLVTGIAFARSLEARGRRADIAMGHSLGEYTALVHAGVLDFRDALRVVRRRGLLMETASEKTGGTMAAVIGAERSKLKEAIGRCSGSGFVEITNFNSPSQVVLSGEHAALDEAIRIIEDEKIGKAMRLNVSAPFHSSLMKPVAEEFERFLAGIEFSKPAVGFIDNVSGNFEREPENIRKKLVLQLSSPVQWESSVIAAFESGAREFIECGPGSVLSGLVKRIVRGVTILSGEKIVAEQR